MDICRKLESETKSLRHRVHITQSQPQVRNEYRAVSKLVELNEVAVVTFSDSDSAYVPKIFNPVPGRNIFSNLRIRLQFKL